MSKMSNPPAGSSHPGNKNPGTPSQARVRAARRAISKRKNRGWRAIRRDALRVLWAEVVKTRDGFACRKCGRSKEQGWQIHGSHILGAGAHANIKYEVSNGLTLCARCHRFFHDHTAEWDSWVKQTIGIDGYTKLLVLAKTMYRPSKTMIKIALHEELRRVKDAAG